MGRPVNILAAGVTGQHTDKDLRVPSAIPCYSHHRGSKRVASVPGQPPPPPTKKKTSEKKVQLAEQPGPRLPVPRRRRPLGDVLAAGAARRPRPERERARARTRSFTTRTRYGFPSRGFHSGGPKHSEGLRLKKLPKWHTLNYDPDSRHESTHRKTTTSLRPWDRVSWEHAALDLRQHRRRPHEPNRSLTDRRNLAREAAWNPKHAVSVSKDNVRMPRSGRAYFRDPKELSRDGMIMGTRPSRVRPSAPSFARARARAGRSRGRGDAQVWRTIARPTSPSIEDLATVGSLALYGRDVVATPGSLDRPSTGHSVLSAAVCKRLDEFQRSQSAIAPRPATAPVLGAAPSLDDDASWMD